MSFVVSDIVNDYGNTDFGNILGTYTTDGTLAYVTNGGFAYDPLTYGGTTKLYINTLVPTSYLVFSTTHNSWVIIGTFSMDSGCGYVWGGYSLNPQTGYWYEAVCWLGTVIVSVV